MKFFLIIIIFCAISIESRISKKRLGDLIDRITEIKHPKKKSRKIRQLRSIKRERQPRMNFQIPERPEAPAYEMPEAPAYEMPQVADKKIKNGKLMLEAEQLGGLIGGKDGMLKKALGGLMSAFAGSKTYGLTAPNYLDKRKVQDVKDEIVRFHQKRNLYSLERGSCIKEMDDIIGYIEEESNITENSALNAIYSISGIIQASNKKQNIGIHVFKQTVKKLTGGE